MPEDAVLVVIAAGLSRLDVKLLGPLHEYVVAPVAEPVSVSVAPVHRDVADGVADTAFGAVLIVIAAVVAVVDPQLLLATNV